MSTHPFLHGLLCVRACVSVSRAQDAPDMASGVVPRVAGDVLRGHRRPHRPRGHIIQRHKPDTCVYALISLRVCVCVCVCQSWSEPSEMPPESQEGLDGMEVTEISHEQKVEILKDKVREAMIELLKLSPEFDEAVGTTHTRAASVL